MLNVTTCTSFLASTSVALSASAIVYGTCIGNALKWFAGRRGLAAGAGVQSAFATITPPALFFFEPHQPELCNFTPNTFLDITAVMESKRAAMAEMKAQKYLQSYYQERAGHRANHARRSSGNADIRQAEAFQRVTPQVVSAL